MKILLALSVTATGLFAGVASAADGSPTVYRCGNSYQATPCTGGKALESDARSPAEVAAARDVAARDRQLADAMVRDRERLEASAQPAAAIGIGARQAAAAPAKPAKARSKAKKRTKDGAFVAMVPGSGKKKKPV